MLYLQQQLGIKSYRAVWLMGQKIRHAMLERDALYTLNGTVQADEIFIGGKQTRAHQKALGTDKTAFLIGVEEDWKGRPRFVTFEELAAIYDEQIISAIGKKIEKGSTVKSDGAATYQKIRRKGFKNLRSVYTKNPVQTAEHLKWVNMLTSNLKRFLLSRTLVSFRNTAMRILPNLHTDSTDDTGRIKLSIDSCLPALMRSRLPYLP